MSKPPFAKRLEALEAEVAALKQENAEIKEAQRMFALALRIMSGQGDDIPVIQVVRSKSQ